MGKAKNSKAELPGIRKLADMARRLRRVNDHRRGTGQYHYDGPPEAYRPFPPPEEPKALGILIDDTIAVLEELHLLLSGLAQEEFPGQTYLEGICGRCQSLPWMFGGCTGRCYKARLKALAGLEDEQMKHAKANREKAAAEERAKKRGKGKPSK